MDICSFFRASSVTSSQSEDENDSSKSDTEYLEPSPAKKKKLCTRSAKTNATQLQAIKSTTRNWKRASIGSSLMTTFKQPLAFAGREELLFKEQEEHGFQSLSKSGRIEKMKVHAKSEIHLQSCEAEMAAAT